MAEKLWVASGRWNKMATQKQLEYLHDLMKGRNSYELKKIGMTMSERSGNFSHTSQTRISKYIDELRNMR